MQAFEYSCPTKIVCGAHALRKLADELRDHHVEKPLVLTDANLVKLGVTRHATEPLEEAGIPFVTFDAIPPDSSLDVVNEVVRVYLDSGCDGFVALGGGSVIDTGKGAAASISCEGEDFALLQGAEILRGDRPPFFAIPTTAGTGSEVTLVAVVADTAANAKLSYTSYRLVPDVAFLDPALTQSLPPKLTSTTGMDALTHAIEAYTSVQKNPVSDAFATGAIELIARNIFTACETPGDADARTALALGSLMAGAAFSNAMVGIVHAVGHSLGGLCHIPHGIDLRPLGQSGLGGVFLGNKEGLDALPPGAQGHGQHSRAGPQLPRQGQLPHKGARPAGQLQLPSRSQNAHQDGQVIEGARLFQMGGSQIDRNAADRKGEAGILDGGAHPLPGLADGGVGQAHHREGGQSSGQIALAGHRVAGNPVQAQGPDGTYHGETSFRIRGWGYERCVPILPASRPKCKPGPRRRDMEDAGERPREGK